MGFNPLDEKGIPIENQVRNWSQLNVKPLDRMATDPYTRTRVILMNGIEVESAIFLHQMARHTTDPQLKQRLAMTRRAEQQQQKQINWLLPGDATQLETTLGYEQVAVDLTAWLARTEPDPYVKQALDFALLEDFDHLYRYANLMTLDTNLSPAGVVGELTEITPGRPTMLEHRHPFDDVRRPYDKNTADILTKLHVATIVAAEQQTMNYYMNVGPQYETMLGRGLYLEIAQIEEQHVTHYESLADPTMTWFEHLLLHDYNEAYLYYSCMESESDPRVKAIWEENLDMEIAHVQLDLALIEQHEKRDGKELLPSEFPQLTIFQSNKEYVREVLATQMEQTTLNTEFVAVDDLPADARYFGYQQQVNGGRVVPSRDVITEQASKAGMDYRLETEGPHPVESFRDRGEPVREPAHP
ncbi:MAG: SAM domain-containing protein [Anaerolineae bacterium]